MAGLRYRILESIRANGSSVAWQGRSQCRLTQSQQAEVSCTSSRESPKLQWSFDAKGLELSVVQRVPGHDERFLTAPNVVRLSHVACGIATYLESI